MKKRFIAAILTILVMGCVMAVGYLGIDTKEPEKTEEELEENKTGKHKETLYLWYADDVLTDYLSGAAVTFNESREDVRVVPVLKSGSEYLENIDQASVAEEEMPDLYIIGNDSLARAQLDGVASVIDVPEGTDLSAMFPETALHAVTYHGDLVAYPFYFETSTLLYNDTYLKEWAVSSAQAQFDQEEGERAQAEADAGNVTADSYSAEEADEIAAQAGDAEAEENAEELAPEVQALADEKYAGALPKTFDALLQFADEYDAPSQMEGLLKWDVTDIFYNYFFIGDAFLLGGADGDDKNQADLYNERAIRGLQVYQDLNQFFSIDTVQISYDSALQDFIDGKTLYFIATSDAVNKIQASQLEKQEQLEAQEAAPKTTEEELPEENLEEIHIYEFGATLIPDIEEGYQARSLSETAGVVINGYSRQKKAANEFAAFLVSQDKEYLYARTGKMSALSNTKFENELLNAFMEEYQRSVPVAKLPETGNYWLVLESAFESIWDGEDANKKLRVLSEGLMEQLSGEEVSLEPIVIEVPVEETEDLEEGESEESVGGSGETSSGETTE